MATKTLSTVPSVCKDQVPEHVIDQVKCKSSLDCFQLFCIWHSPAVQDLGHQGKQPTENQVDLGKALDRAVLANPKVKLPQSGSKKDGQLSSSPPKKSQQRQKQRRARSRSGSSPDPVLQEGTEVTHQLANIWRTLPTREKNVYRQLVPVLLRKQADTQQPGQKEQLDQPGPEAQTSISPRKHANSASTCQGKGDGLSPTFLGVRGPAPLGNASGPNRDNKVEDQTALAVAAAGHDARGKTLAENSHSCSAAVHHEEEDKSDELSPDTEAAVATDHGKERVLASSASIQIPRSGSPVLPASVLSSSPQSIHGLFTTKEMALSGLHAGADLEQRITRSMTRKKAKKKAKKRQANEAQRKEAEAKSAHVKERRKVHFSPMAEVLVFARAQVSSAVPIEGAHPLALGNFVAKSLVPLHSDADPADGAQRKGSNEQPASKVWRRHPCHGPKEEELTPLEEKQRIRILRNALGAQWDDKDEVCFAALEAKECQTIRNSRSKNCCDCGTGKNRTSRCDTAKCACHRAGVGCHAEGGSYCQCTIHCCQNAEGRYQFKGAVVNKARKRQISDYWAFVASAEYQWPPQSRELSAHIGLIDWAEAAEDVQQPE